jgi:hypothetical protein
MGECYGGAGAHGCSRYVVLFRLIWQVLPWRQGFAALTQQCQISRTKGIPRETEYLGRVEHVFVRQD